MVDSEVQTKFLGAESILYATAHRPWPLPNGQWLMTQTWNDLGVPGTDLDYLAANPTALPYAGFRGSTFSAALTMRPASTWSNSSRAMSSMWARGAM